jgi:hypothetical protein
MLYNRHLSSEHLQLKYTTVTIITLSLTYITLWKQTQKHAYGPEAMLRHWRLQCSLVARIRTMLQTMFIREYFVLALPTCYFSIFYEIAVRKATEQTQIKSDTTTIIYRIRVNVMFEGITSDAVKTSFTNCPPIPQILNSDARTSCWNYVGYKLKHRLYRDISSCKVQIYKLSHKTTCNTSRNHLVVRHFITQVSLCTESFVFDLVIKKT